MIMIRIINVSDLLTKMSEKYGGCTYKKMDEFFQLILKNLGKIFFCLIILWFIAPYIAKLFAPKPLPFKSVSTENTDWLNFSVERFLETIDSPKTIDKISNLVSNQLSPNYFKLHSIGQSPTISHISTLEMKEADDIRIVIPVEMKVGPSFDIGFKRKKVILEFDILKLKTELLFTWPGNSETQVEISFVNKFDLDFYLSIKLFGFFHFSISEAPIIGTLFKCGVSTYIGKQVFRMKLPRPSLNESKDHNTK